jgi:tyrosyl-tRNA synthetase
LSEEDFLSVFEGVPQATIARKEAIGSSIVDLLALKSGFLSSNSEARRALKENAISVNKEKVNEQFVLSESNLINNLYVLLQRGKKNYCILVLNTE